MNEIDERIKVLIEYAKNHDLHILIAVTDNDETITAASGYQVTLQGLIFNLMLKVNEANQ